MPAFFSTYPTPLRAGGGVYNNCGTFTMNGGSIEGNKAASRGGGVYVRGNTDPDDLLSGDTSIFKIVGGGIADEIAAGVKYTFIILGGYFGTKAKNSIFADWLGPVHSWANNGGSKAYPKDTYPYRVK